MGTVSNHSRSSTRKPLALVAVLVCMAAFGNSLVTYLMWNERGEYDALIDCFFCGILIAQPCLLSVWCASIKQRLISRISASMGILLVLFFVYMLTLRELEPMPLEVPVACLGIIVVLSLMIQIPLLLLRRFTNSAISIGSPEESNGSDSQFEIKHLMIATTVVAVLVALAQTTVSNLGFEGGAPWGEILTFLISLAVLTSTICLLSFSLVFLDRIRIAATVLLTVAVLLGPAIVYGILFNLPGFGSETVLFNTLAYAIGLAGTISAVLLSFYGLGYRMYRLDPGD